MMNIYDGRLGSAFCGLGWGSVIDVLHRQTHEFT